MTLLQQTVEIPADHRLILDVPCEVPSGPVILTFTPAADAKPLEPCFEGAVNPSIRGTIKVTGNIIGPFFDELCLTEERTIPPLRGFFKGSAFTVDRFLEERHTEDTL